VVKIYLEPGVIPLPGLHPFDTTKTKSKIEKIKSRGFGGGGGGGASAAAKTKQLWFYDQAPEK